MKVIKLLKCFFPHKTSTSQVLFIFEWEKRQGQSASSLRKRQKPSGKQGPVRRTQNPITSNHGGRP